MHGREGEEGKRRQIRHMLQVPSGAGAVAAAATVNSKQNSSDSFVKDGRKIQIGDCALFQAGNAPPFIGLIRWLNTGSGDYFKLGVNWLYRPADIKLSKGAQLEAAPNEVFYSFHRDEIPAASLLHPCKVAFLRKGVELPTGISSFVCRRVYDIANKCLWWLTDQDYINERQEEVDQLLDRTQLEMHAPVQSGGRSPKPSNGSSSAQQLKTISEGAQNSGTTFPQQVKVKKRERNETEPIKRERPLKVEDGDSVSSKLDSVIKGELAKITDKGGLMNIEAVEKLVHLMQLDRADRKLDLGGRVLLADVISGTERYDCLGRFVQLRGVSVLDEWLQEAHRGKAGDSSSPKESDRPVEELLLALLRALDKLPVNLNALQACNVGKSVNQLRSHKNLEIQKKARSLVETWKKRVDAEMTKLNDAKSASTWPVKQGFAEVSHGGNRRTGPTELVMKSSITQPSTCKTLSSKPGHTESITKTTAVIPGPLKTAASLPSPVSNTLKDAVAKSSSGASDIPPTIVKEEKSSSSNQSQNNSQSCSGDPMKATGSSWKEDARNLTAGSVISCKPSASVSRHRRASNGFVGTTISGTQKDTNLGKSGLLNRTTTLDKVTQSGLICERQPDVPVADLGNSSHRLIVRLPNPGRSPARSASGGSFEDPSMTGSRSSSPGVPDKTDHVDRRTKIKGEPCRSNISMDGHTDLWQNNDTKEGLVGSDEGVKSQATNAAEEACRNAEDIGKFANLSRTSSSSLGNEKEIVPHDAKLRNSFSSMNALIESCANEATALSAGDDIGINLLASVAAGEMSKSLASPSGSPGSSPMMEDNETKPRLPSDGPAAQSHFQPPDNADVDSGKPDKGAGSVVNRDESRQSALVSVDDKTIVPLLENKLTADAKGVLNGEGTHQHGDEQKAFGTTNDSFTDCKTKVKGLVSEEKKSLECLPEKITEEEKPNFACVATGDGCSIKDVASTMKIEKVVVGDSTCPHPKIEAQKHDLVEEGAASVALTEQHPAPLPANYSEAVDRSEHISDSSSVVQHVKPPGVDDSKAENSSSLRGRSPSVPVDGERKDQPHLPPSAADDHLPSTLAIKGPEVISDRKELGHHCATEAGKSEASSIIPARETEPSRSSGSKVSGPDVDHNEETATSTDASLAASAGPDCTSKIDFDLNEGFLGDDGHQSEPVSVPVPVCSPTIHLPSLPHFTSSSIPHGSPAPVTVAAPAKGPFVPPENLLKGKAEPGWKGSAATSAFRPAEPRKVLEMPLSTSDVPSSDANVGKQSRPALDIDLNVPDERVLEDMASQSSAQTTGSESGVVNNRDAPVRVAGGLDLDLNRVDEGPESGLLVNTNRRMEFPLLPMRAAQTSLPNADTSNLRDFDLNGPGIDEAGAESGMRNQAKGSNLTLLPPIAGLRMNNSELGNVSTWFPPSNSYPAVAIPSFLHDRGDHPYPIVAAAGAQRIPGPATGTTFGADIYRHQVLTSSPAMAFSHTTSFPYAGFPFGSSFPVASNSFAGAPPTYGDSSAGAGPFFPTIPSQIMGPAGAVSSHYHQRPYVISFPESSTTGGSDSNRKWARPGLDLNAGPGSVDAEARDERLSSAPRQLGITSTQAFVEEQARMFQTGGGLKRKEPEGGWDAERFAYKQSSWH